MKELQTIADTYHRMTEQKISSAMATVVQVRGSAYRRPGARMLIADTGHFAGSVSGGCLEEQTMEHAREVMRSGVPRLIDFDTRLNSKDAIGMGYGCNGMLDILIEPMSQQGVLMRWLDDVRGASGRCGMATVYRTTDAATVNVGARLFKGSGGVQCAGFEAEELREELLKGLSKAIEEGVNRSANVHWKGVKLGVLYEVFQPAVRLLVYGAVFHTIHVLRLTEALGWEVAVRDDPSTSEKLMDFPGAEDLVVHSEAEERRLLEHPSRLAVLFLTHNFMHIMDKLQEILPMDPAYVGILGSRKKTQKILGSLEDRGFRLTPQNRDVLHYPVGLDIGGDRPESIALSIVSEIHAVMYGRAGGSLKDRRGNIHSRSRRSA